LLLGHPLVRERISGRSLPVHCPDDADVLSDERTCIGISCAPITTDLALGIGDGTQALAADRREC
jgi:hypothetical protein